MVEKGQKVPQEANSANANTEESSIAHINNLINDDDYTVKEPEENYEPVAVDPDSEMEDKPVRQVPINSEKNNPSKPSAKPKIQINTAVKIEPVKKIQKINTPVAQKKEIKKEVKVEIKPKIVLKQIKKTKHVKVEKKIEKSIKYKEVEGEKMKPKKHVKKDDKSKWLWIIIGVVVVIGITSAIILLPKNQGEVKNKEVNQVAATVNGEAIYFKDVQDQYNKLNPVLQKTYTIDSLLNQTIDQVLLLQEAKNQNIQITKEEVKSEVDNFKAQNNYNEEQFAQVLQKQGITLDDLNALIEKKFKIRNLINSTVLSKVQISDSEIQKFYDDNLAKFAVPGQVTVRHILIMTNDNVTLDQAKTKINEIKNMVTTTGQDNFCDLVNKYTDDAASKSTCGTYTFGHGEMVPEFENASYEMNVGELRTVQSVFGWHLINKLNETNGKTQSLDEVSSEVKTYLYDNKAQVEFDKMLTALRSKATIIYYLGDTGAKNNNTINPTDPKLMTPTPVETKPAPLDTPAKTTVTSTNLDAFAKCLTEKKAAMYGAYWCSHCANQKTMFGDSFKYVTYVECAVEGQPEVQVQACIDAKISGYPTWIINGKQYAGEQTIDSLAKLTGCSK